MQQLNDNFKIGVYSLGLIGGSIIKGLKRAGGASLFACTRNQETVKTLADEGICASVSPEILKECDIIFVCSPISKTVDAIKELFAINPNALFVDVASLKSEIINGVQKIEGCRFVGSHPMAGTEHSGFNASFAELFEDAVWVLIPTNTSSEDDLNLLNLIITMLGAQVVILDAQEHDKAVAKISHLPMLLAQSLILSAKDDEKALALAASGFRDTTRLAMSNKVMAKDMLSLNKVNIKSVLEDVVKNAQELLSSDFFDENIDKIVSCRTKLYNLSGKNNFRNNG